MQGMNAHVVVRTGEKMVAMGSQPKGGAGVDSDRELMPEGARSISQGLWRMVRLPHRGKRLSASYLLPWAKLCSSTRCPLDLTSAESADALPV